MKKRDFIKSLGTASLGLPLLGFSSEWVSELESIPDTALTTDEDFWKKVRADYKLKPEYINLESGYYNIIPQPTLKRLQQHINTVNYEGSYYMRTVQWETRIGWPKNWHNYWDVPPGMWSSPAIPPNPWI